MIVYSRSSCAPCYTLKYWLNKKDIPFEERNIDDNPEYETELNKLGFSSVPLTVIGEHKITGANFMAIRNALSI